MASASRVPNYDVSVDGAAVTHYAFTLDFTAFFARVGEASKALGSSATATALKQLASLINLSSVPGEAWIDGNGRVRRFDFTIAAAAEGHTVKVVEDLNFSYFDEPVVVAVPAASDTVSFRDFPDFFSKVAAAARAAITG